LIHNRVIRHGTPAADVHAPRANCRGGNTHLHCWVSHETAQAQRQQVRWQAWPAGLGAAAYV
jgi:hypothetical protein